MYLFSSRAVQRCVFACPGGVTIPLGANERNRWSTKLRSATPPPPAPPHRPRYLLYPSCQVVAVEQNKVNRGPTRVPAVSTNEGVLRCSSERVQVFACSRQPVIHHASSQTSFRSHFRQISGELLLLLLLWLCVRVDVRAACPSVRPSVCLFWSHLPSCAAL